MVMMRTVRRTRRRWLRSRRLRQCEPGRARGPPPPGQERRPELRDGRQGAGRACRPAQLEPRTIPAHLSKERNSSMATPSITQLCPLSKGGIPQVRAYDDDLHACEEGG